jgi:gamma-glutamylcyclotransferase (GGCT)/AIG2-like uncharacterized protein YtfP
MSFSVSWGPESWAEAALKWVTLAAAIVGIVGAWIAVRSYRDGVRLKRAEWLQKLHEQFYGSDRYREMRTILDYESDPEFSLIKKYLAAQTRDQYVSQLFDYLNFFEFVAALEQLRQLKFDHLMLLFEYPLKIIARSAYAQATQGGYEQLAALLRDPRFMNRPGNLFVYGSLRPEVKNKWSRFLSESGKRIGSCSAPGILYDLGDYPALVLSVDGGDRVQGETYEIDHPRTWERLDGYEGAEFERRLISVRRSNDTEMDSWAYVYRGDASGKPRILSGDYLNR